MQEFQYYSPPKFEKSQKDTDLIISVLAESFLTSHLNQQDLNLLAGAMQQRVYKADDFVIKYGDVGNEYFILGSGSVDILVYKEGTAPNDPELDKKIAVQKHVSTPMGFGEIALMYNDKRTATVRATSDCICWVIEA
jgi:CRP-like cAMP-binding protein